MTAKRTADRSAARSERSQAPEAQGEMSFHDELLAHLPKLRAHAMVMTRDRHRADDLVQETVMRALRAQDTYRPGTQFGAWTYRIMRNLFISSTRRQRGGAPALEDLDPALMQQGAQQEDSLILSELQTGLTRLPESYREALMLVGAQGMTYEEAAALCDCSVGTMKSRVFRARREMQAYLMGEAEAKTTRRSARLPQQQQQRVPAIQSALPQ